MMLSPFKGSKLGEGSLFQFIKKLQRSRKRAWRRAIPRCVAVEQRNRPFGETFRSIRGRIRSVFARFGDERFRRLKGIAGDTAKNSSNF
jgi:hypothetical protein